jgi:hypothetical protein
MIRLGLGKSSMVLLTGRCCARHQVLVSTILPCHRRHDSIDPFSKPQACGKYERIFSDHYDYVHSSSFSGTLFTIFHILFHGSTPGLTTMTRFGSDDPFGQKYIGRKDFYCRYHLERNARRLEVKCVFYAIINIHTKIQFPAPPR